MWKRLGDKINDAEFVREAGADATREGAFEAWVVQAQGFKKLQRVVVHTSSQGLMVMRPTWFSKVKRREWVAPGQWPSFGTGLRWVEMRGANPAGQLQSRYALPRSIDAVRLAALVGSGEAMSTIV